jgi:hypothetical protein
MRNLISDYGPAAIALCCDACCVENEPPTRIKFAIEDAGDNWVFHSVEELQSLGPEPTCVVAPDGSAIKCLVCGLTSHHPEDVRNRYCSHCHAFHPFGAGDSNHRVARPESSKGVGGSNTTSPRPSNTLGVPPTHD